MLSRKEIQRVLTNGTIVSTNTAYAQQGICGTFVGSAVLEQLTVPVLYKYYGDAEDTLREGNMELAARWCAQYFPYVELPPAVVRPLPKTRHFEAGIVGGVQFRITDATVARDAYDCGWHQGPHANNFDCFAAGIFDMLIANTDRHQGNWLWRESPNRKAKQRNIVLIDHGLCFRRYTRPDVSCTGSYFSQWRYRRLPHRNLTQPMLRGLTEIALRARTETSAWLDEEQADALATRARLLVREGYPQRSYY